MGIHCRKSKSFEGLWNSELIKVPCNGSEIVKWLQLCTGLVNFADTVDRAKLDPFLREHIDDKVGDSASSS